MTYYKVKVERVIRAKLEAKYSWEVEAENEAGQYISLYKKTKYPTSGYAYRVKTAKRRCLKAILNHNLNQGKYKIVFDFKGTAGESEKALS